MMQQILYITILQYKRKRTNTHLSIHNLGDLTFILKFLDKNGKHTFLHTESKSFEADKLSFQ